jgi:hypothetical protein
LFLPQAWHPLPWGRKIHHRCQKSKIDYVSALQRDQSKDLLSDNLTWHASLCRIDQSIFTQGIHLDAQLILHKLDSFPARESVPSNNRRWMNFSLDEFVRATKELCCDYHDRGRAVSDFLVLLLRKFDKDAASWMLYWE